MIPILFDTNETEFTTNGLGRLSDAADCTVTEERNGQYELEMQYPVTGIHYADLLEERIVFAVPSEGTPGQPFRIYRITKPIDGIVTVYAQHISYMLKKMVVMPFTASSPSAAMAAVESSIVGDNPFSFWTDKTTAGSMSLQVPAECRSILGGTEGSVLDSFGGGEYEFDRFAVKLHENRGADNGVTIRYGKNLTGLETDANYENTYTAVVPYWQGQGESGASITVIGDKVESEHTGDYSYQKCVTMDFSQDFQTQPTKQQLADAAKAYMKNNSVWAPTMSTDVEYQPLWQSGEYADIATLERVRLCDIVTVEDMRLGVSVKAKVIETVYDVLQDRYRSVQLGDARSTLSDTVARKSDVDAAIRRSETWLEQAVREASALISGGLGGHVVIKANADGKPEEILIMDTDDINTAQKVWRWNMGGLGYSSTGYDGPYGTAITMDGQIIADWIRAGTMQANRIKGGTLTMGGKDNGNGVIEVLDQDGALVAKIDSDFITQYAKNGKPAIKIGNTIIWFYSWEGNGDPVGEISSILSADKSRKGLSLAADDGDLLVLGYRNNDQSGAITPAIRIDGADKTSPPYVAYTANGNIFKGSEHPGITVKNGLITGWNIGGATGSLFKSDSLPGITVENGLIKSWSMPGSSGKIFGSNSGGGITVDKGLITGASIKAASGDIVIPAANGHTVTIKVGHGIIETWSWS